MLQPLNGTGGHDRISYVDVARTHREIETLKITLQGVRSNVKVISCSHLCSSFPNCPKC